MWFLRGRPISIDALFAISSLPMGYQGVNYRFRVSGDPQVENFLFGVAIPIAPQKKNGGFILGGSNHLAKLEPINDCQILTESDICIHENIRKLKRATPEDLNVKDLQLTFPICEPILIQELCSWYLDDVGLITTWIKPNRWYQLNYKHKIASDSQLFVPTRLPIVISNAKVRPSVNCKIWVLDGFSYQLSKHLVRLQHSFSPADFNKEGEGKHSRLDYYTIDSKWHWEEDSRFSTDNWESSDDDLANDSD